jgi:hypothetical protein
LTSTKCDNLQFKLQNHEFETEVRVLDVQGYDLILGIDWLSSFGQMTVDWSKGMRKLKHKGKQVILQVQDVTAELKVCQGTVDLHKEKKKGSHHSSSFHFTRRSALFVLKREGR